MLNKSDKRTRQEYKAVWTDLSESEQQARAHVIGDVTEEYLQATADETVVWLEETVGVKPEDTILEIGCGIGRVGMALSPKCKKWIGCDVSPNMLKHAKERLSDVDNIELVEISGFDLSPIEDDSIDVVYCTVVFMHLDEWDRYNYVLEARRVLRPGGRIFVDNFNLCSDGGWEVFETHRNINPQERPAHISKSSTSQEIEVYLQRAGFQSVEVRLRKSWIQGCGVK